MVDLLFILVKIVVVFVALLLSVAYLTWLERKVLGHMQSRLGPHRVGINGLLQPIADGIKLFFKEDVIVTAADKVVYHLAPFIIVSTALLTIAVIPFGDAIKIFGHNILLRIADVNIGLLYIFALSSLGVYGIVLAGWSSNNKYALMGGLRSAAQMVSYELPLGLSTIGVLMQAESLSLSKIVQAQAAQGWFFLPQFIGFLIFFICAVAECNRTPFDLPEAEGELVAGFHIEYSSMKFALFFMAEYASVILMSALIVTLFFGGWLGPSFISCPAWCGPIWFGVKVFIFSFIFIWLRATFPRFRYDQLMKFGWKVLFPLSIINIAVTAVVMMR
ncbi:MAG: NADH-quinone oxidoreductase subunit NuoH [Thermodesulfobacteriota bacterium]|jgi:NADH-quinone oxidoreductase subunit H|nr:MAG: NADH-quinone oxidoreductase subunit NuoH [Thermodesulfobacteriota bacterium]